MSDSPDEEFPPFLWSVGDNGVAELPAHLRRVMTYSANAAMSRLSSEDVEEALTSAVMLGLSVETAIKYVLSKANPVLLADKRSPRSMAFLADPTSAPLQVKDLRTVNGLEALEMLQALRPNQRTTLKPLDLQVVLDVRNAAIHMGVVEMDALHAAARNMVKILEIVLGLEGEDADEIWRPEILELIDQLEVERATAIVLRIASKRAKAGAHLEALRRQHGPHLAAIVAALGQTSTARDNGETTVVFSCPVCGSTAVLHRYVTDSNLDFSGMSYPSYRPDGARYAYPEYFECPVCGFELDAEEIDEDSSFAEVLEEQLDPSDEFYEALNDWEADSLREFELEEQRREWNRFD